MARPDLQNCRQQMRENLPMAHERAIQKLEAAAEYYKQVASIVRNATSLAEVRDRLGRLPSERLDIEWRINVDPAFREATGLSPELSPEDRESSVLRPIEEIQSTYEKTLEGLSKGEFQYECEYREGNVWYYEHIQGCDLGTSGWVLEYLPSISDIHICVDNIDPQNIDELANSIVHEASHKFGETTDDLADRTHCAHAYELSTGLPPREDWGWRANEPAPWEPPSVCNDAAQTSAGDYFTGQSDDGPACHLTDAADAAHVCDAQTAGDYFSGRPDSGPACHLTDEADGDHICDAQTAGDYFTGQPDSGPACHLTDEADSHHICDAQTAGDHFTGQPDSGPECHLTDEADSHHICDAQTAGDYFTGQPDSGPACHLADGTDGAHTCEAQAAGDYFTWQADSGIPTGHVGDAPDGDHIGGAQTAGDYFTMQSESGPSCHRTEGGDGGQVGDGQATGDPFTFQQDTGRSGQPDSGSPPGQAGDATDGEHTCDAQTAGDYFAGQPDSGPSCPAPDTSGGAADGSPFGP